MIQKEMKAVVKANAEIKKAIFCFEYVERIKSELMIAAKLLDVIDALKGDQAVGAQKMMSSLLSAIQAEIGMAQNVLELENFKEAEKRIAEAEQKMQENKSQDAVRAISEAISRVTTNGQEAVETLRKEGFL